MQSVGTWLETTRQVQEAEQRNAAEISDLRKQLQDVQKQLGASGQPVGAAQIADLKNQLSSERNERKILSDQVGALSERIDSLVKANAAEPPQQGASRRRRR